MFIPNDFEINIGIIVLNNDFIIVVYINFDNVVVVQFFYLLL